MLAQKSVVCADAGWSTGGWNARVLQGDVYHRESYYVVTQALTKAVHSEMVHETEDATAHARPLLTYVVAAFEQL